MFDDARCHYWKLDQQYLRPQNVHVHNVPMGTCLRYHHPDSQWQPRPDLDRTRLEL